MAKFIFKAQQVLLHPLALGIGVNLAFLITSLLFRPLFFPDETRYIAVSWEMFTQGSYIVPLLNGAPYFHKSPLLFWLTIGSWKLWGETEVVARLVVSSFSLINLLLTYFLAKLIYPKHPSAHAWATFILSCFLGWNIFCASYMFDSLLCSCCLSYLLCMLLFCKKEQFRYILLAGFFAGMGLLAKGPVFLVYTLPVLGCYPFWKDDKHHLTLGPWYRAVLYSTLLGFIILLAWLIPALMVGDSLYLKQILWHQTIDRVTGVISLHNQPFYWYFGWMLVLLVPFTCDLGFWKLKFLKRRETGDIFCILWFVTSFLILSLIKSKQLHYLFPALPALAILFSVHKEHLFTTKKGWQWLWFLLGSIAVLAWPFLFNLSAKVDISYSMVQCLGLIPLLVFCVLFYTAQHTDSRMKCGFMMTPLFTIVFTISTAVVFKDHENLRAMAEQVATLEKHREVAIVGAYYGEYQFYGRLKQSILPISSLSALLQHPQAMVIIKANRDNHAIREASMIEMSRGPLRVGQSIYIVEAKKLYNVLHESNLAMDARL